MSRIRANTITNQNANGAPNFPDGITVSGVVTATTTSQNITGDLTVTGNIGVGGTLTYEDVTNIDSVGVVTARAGVNVVGNDLNVGSNIKLGNASGIVTATSFSGSGANLTGISPTTTQGDLIVRGASADGRLAIGAAGKVLKVNSSANGLEYGTGSTVLQVKTLYNSNTPVSFSGQSSTSLGANSIHYPVGARFGGTFTKLSSTSKIIVFGKMSYVMSNTNVHGAICWVVGDESNVVNLMEDSRKYGTYGNSYAHFNPNISGITFNTAYNAGSVTVYAAPAFSGSRSSTGILNGNPHSNSIQGNADCPNKDAHSLLSIMEFEP